MKLRQRSLGAGLQLLFLSFTSGLILQVPVAAWQEDGLDNPGVGMEEAEVADAPMCTMVANQANFENVIHNRIRQIRAVVDLTDQQQRKLEVAGKRLLLDENGENDKVTFFGNPLASSQWTAFTTRILTEEQRLRLAVFDADIQLRILTGDDNDLIERNNSPEIGLPESVDPVTARANLEYYLFLTEEQATGIEPLIAGAFSRSDSSLPLKEFIEENRPLLQELLTDSQSELLDHLDSEGVVPADGLWSNQWRTARCADCHR